MEQKTREIWILVPNKSLGAFVLGEEINKYFNLKHYVTHYEEKETSSYDSYEFYELNVIVWVENGKITTIKSDTECYWQGKNLIKMSFEQFLIDYKLVPDESAMIYTLVSENRGQNQMVYDFEDLSLQIWVWRKKIVTVIVSNYHDIKDE
jgi:hypothetical protein